MRNLLQSALAIVGGSTVACGGRIPLPPYIAQPQDSLVAVEALPPPARVEYLPPRPAVRGAVWLDGEWARRRGRWAWKLGRWIVLQPGLRFSPWTAVRATDGSIYFAPGTVRDEEGKPVDEPVPLAEATAATIGVLEPDGLPAITGPTIRRADGK